LHTSRSAEEFWTEGIDIVWDLMQEIYEQEKMPTEWRDIVIVPICREKGDTEDCGNYTGIKVMSHTMTIWKKIIEARLREETSIGEEQFGFISGKSTTNASFILRQTMENNQGKKTGLHMVFIDLEMAYDRVPEYEDT